MNVTPINNIKFQAKPKIDDELFEIKEEKPRQEGYSKGKVCSIAAAAALSAAVIGGVIGHKQCERSEKLLRASIEQHHESVVRSLKNTIDSCRERYSDLLNSAPYQENRTLKQKVTDLTENNETLQKANQALKKSIAETRDKFNEIFEGDLAPKDLREKIAKALREKIEKGDYGYDISTPPVTGKRAPKQYSDAIELPESAGTINRAGMRELHIPEIGSDGKFNFEIPMSDEVKITRMPSVNFKPVSQMTNISESYADSVQWNNDKISRDLLQNFFDGHGQTLDGVKFNFVPAGNGRYKVRIEGKSSYTPDKAVYIGESTKRNDTKAAGNYGEGLKMSVLKLLRDGGAQEVKIGSDNWKLTYNLAEGNLSDKRVLAYNLDKVDKYDGNFVEFETSDLDLLRSLRKTINRFYHSGNTHFKCPDFENSLVGIKNLPKGEKGGIYIAGQRFEFDGKYDGLDDIVIFLKEKPPVKVLDPSRDRTSLNSSQLEDIAYWLAQDSRMTKDDKVKLLKSLENYWDEKDYGKMTPMDNFVNKFLLWSQNVHIKFPEKYVAYSSASDDVVLNLKMNGYKVCNSYFEALGMPTIKDLYGDARAHDVVIPNDVQKKKILILKEAINKLSSSLKDKHFTADELDTRIYMFDNKGAKDSKMYSDCLAEAITDNGTSKGFWIDKNYLDRAEFKDVLETALHELSHKSGGDESAAFSYKLTDVNRDAIGQLLDDAQTRSEFQALASIWNGLK